MGPIYDGLMHFLMSPEDLVPALALALLAGLRGAAYGRRASFTLPVAWLAGSLFGLTAAATTGSAVLSSFWFLLLGGLVIADAKLSLSAMTVLAALLGLVHGYLNGTGMGQSGFAVVARPWIDFRGVCSDRPCCRVRGSVAGTMGTNRRTRCRKLDRCQRFADARLVVSRKVTVR